MFGHFFLNLLDANGVLAFLMEDFPEQVFDDFNGYFLASQGSQGSDAH